jgi:hypothetical protein
LIETSQKLMAEPSTCDMFIRVKTRRMHIGIYVIFFSNLYGFFVLFGSSVYLFGTICHNHDQFAQEITVSPISDPGKWHWIEPICKSTYASSSCWFIKREITSWGMSIRGGIIYFDILKKCIGLNARFINIKTRDNISWRSEHPDLDPFHVQKILVVPLR